MRILSVVGARPQFVKLAPIANALDGRAEHIVVHTGQHYDELLSEVFFRDLGIPAPDVNLAVGSASHGAQTASMLEGLEPVLEKYQPDWVLVYGDTNSTLAAALAAVKLHLPLAHLEAGLRSFNRRMPEEHNRVLTDHAAGLLLAPTEVAMRHPAHEGLVERSIPVGDVMTDVLFTMRRANAARGGLAPGVTCGEYYLATIHRPDNPDTSDRLAAIVDGLSALDHPVLLLVYPRLAVLAERHGIDLGLDSIRSLDPLAYPQLVAAVEGRAGAATNFGGSRRRRSHCACPVRLSAPRPSGSRQSSSAGANSSRTASPPRCADSNPSSPPRRPTVTAARPSALRSC